MDSKLKLGRKVPDINDMQSLEGRERERGGEEEEEGGSVYALEHNDARSVTVNKVNLDHRLRRGSLFCGSRQ